MSHVAIRIESLSKLIGNRQEPYRALRDTLTNVISAPFRRLRAAVQPPSLLPPRLPALQRRQHHLGPQGRVLRDSAGRDRRLHRPQRGGRNHAAQGMEVAALILYTAMLLPDLLAEAFRGEQTAVDTRRPERE